MEKLSILILDGESDLALQVAHCLALVPGIRLHVVSRYPWSPLGFSRHRVTFHVIKGGISDREKLDFLDRVIKEVEADILFPVQEDAIRFVALYRDHLTRSAAVTPLPDLQLLDRVVDKGSLAELLLQYNIPCPHTLLIAQEGAFTQGLNEISFPVLVKPVKGTNGYGIRHFETKEELAAFLKTKPPTSGRRIIQSYIPGHDVDCSVLCREGEILAYTIQQGFLPGPNRFAPARGIKFIEDPQTFQVVEKFVQVLRWSGVVHIDLRMDRRDGRVWLLEVNARYWATLLGSLNVGVNFPYLACLAGLGRNFPRPSYKTGCFLSAGAAFRQRIPGWKTKGNQWVAFKDTELWYILSDPLAEIAKYIKRIQS